MQKNLTVILNHQPFLVQSPHFSPKKTIAVAITAGVLTGPLSPAQHGRSFRGDLRRIFAEGMASRGSWLCHPKMIGTW